MKKPRWKLAAGIAALAAAICFAQKPASSATELAGSESFYKDEGAHFEVPFEYWSVQGVLREDGSDKPIYFTAHFNRAGSGYFHVRNGYTSLRLADGSHDYRSFGMGVVQSLGQDLLLMRAEQRPDFPAFRRTYERAKDGELDHFTLVPEESAAMHRGRLYINLGGNRLERTSTSAFDYEVDLNSWAGLLKLSLLAGREPLYFDSSRPLRVESLNDFYGPDAGMLVGYAVPRLKVSGSLATKDGEIKLSGEAWLEHWWGKPKGEAMAQSAKSLLSFPDGGDMLAVKFYDADGGQVSSVALYKAPDGSMQRDNEVSFDALESWTSPDTLTIYDVGWKIESEYARGEISPAQGAKDSELMLMRGVGGFWFGPCEFKGATERAASMPASGFGFCRFASVKEYRAD
jgi:predicted secreted hydrolase